MNSNNKIKKMNPCEKVKIGENKSGEWIGEKFKGGIFVGKKEGNCTTPSLTWDFGIIQQDGSLVQNHQNCFSTDQNNSLSARKLGANLWELQPLFNITMPEMSRRRLDSSRRRERKVTEEEPVECPSHQKNKIITRKQVPSSQLQHNQWVSNVGQAQQPLSPSYCRSMKMASHSYTNSPSSSLGSRGKIRESNYGLKTSTELLKVLDRIWSLEDKHALDISLVKMLKSEMDQSQACIKDLLQEKERDHKHIEKLSKQLAEDKAARKYKERDRIEDAIKLVREELDDEMKVRQKSEKLCHRLAHDLSDIKSMYSNALRELEKERKARRIREELCDEFANGIKEYEQELRFMKHKSGEEIDTGRKGNDRLILHMSEAWLDERMQIKLEIAPNMAEKQSVVNKLSLEIETFLREKQSKISNFLKERNKSKFLLHSLESLNEPGSAPWNLKDEDDSKTTAILNPQFSSEVTMPQKPSTGNVNFRNSRPSEASDRQYIMEGSLDPSTFGGPLGPVKKWTSEITLVDPAIPRSSSRRSQSVKPNTLKAKLLEARLEGQQSHARTSKGVTRVD